VSPFAVKNRRRRLLNSSLILSSPVFGGLRGESILTGDGHQEKPLDLKEMLPPADEASASLRQTAALVIPEDCRMSTGSSGTG